MTLLVKNPKELEESEGKYSLHKDIGKLFFASLKKG
jgi:hypothetical protein